MSNAQTHPECCERLFCQPCGCCCEVVEDVNLDKNEADKEPNAQLERELIKDRLKSLFNFKVLLLGAGESGKSTIVKQIKLSHNKKPTKQELRTIADSLHQNVVDCMKALTFACKKFEFELDDDEDKKTADLISTFEDGAKISPELGQKILKLWNSQAIKKGYERRAEFWLLDSCEYYLSNLERFTEENYEPSEEDSVMARIRTTGIVVTNLEEKIPEPKEDEPDMALYQIVDVGGQRNERKKWIHCFDDVKAILFIVNLNAYNQVLYEDSTKNRMHESVELFNQIVTKPMFKNTPIFLFLNKKDLFETMIKDTDLNRAFPEYNGGRDLGNALKFIEDLFRNQMPSRKELYIHVVTARYKRDIKYAFEEVKKTLLALNKKQIDLEKAQIHKEEKVIAKQTAKKRTVRRKFKPCGGACCSISCVSTLSEEEPKPAANK